MRVVVVCSLEGLQHLNIIETKRETCLMKGPIDACMHVSSAEQIERFFHSNVIIAARKGEKSPSCLSMYTSVLSLHICVD